ncbi:Oxysterol-binding protein- protein 1C [Datura stramonium]|uniref:Oxysterol-binding protein- protein 1C n=1 Tax=Datura stramonium TaxID=4076 RepID=A0ABS8T570_DATST|nr:Oxysterol-binding protein- protein 1C [Datura stramonium]
MLPLSPPNRKVATNRFRKLEPDQGFLKMESMKWLIPEKLRLEQRQREASKMQERGWQPRWFAKPKGSDTYQYKEDIGS